MSLQVWLPLNGSLENLGLADTSQISTTNLSFSDNGKIGKCLTGYTGYFNIPSMTGKKQLSVAYWIRINTATSTQWLDAFRWYSTDGSTTYGSRNEFYNNSTRTGVWYKGGSLGDAGLTYTVGTWRHHAFTIDYETGEGKFYIDGVLKYTVSTVDTTHYLTGTNFMIGENGLDTSHNDLRIYDHVLSQKEVKELSKGLVAHYPLNDFVGNPNLVTGVIDGFHIGRNVSQAQRSNKAWGALSGGNGTITVAYDETAPVGSYVYKIEGNTSGNKDIAQYDSVNPFSLDTSKQYTMSAYYRGHGTCLLRMWDSTNDRQLNGQLLAFDTLGAWKRLSYTFYGPEAANGTNAVGFLFGITGIGETDICGMKVEESSAATPWIPNTQDDLYSAMGLDEGVVYDCSGYNNHGENTSCTVSSDSARYHVSTAFDETSYITLHNDSFPVILSNDFTLSMWIYSDDDGDRSLWFGNYGISGSGSFFGFEKNAANGVRFWWNNGSPDKNFATYITKSEGWVLLTLVKEGNVAKIYKNGVLSTTNTSDLYVSANLPSTATTFRLGADGRITGNTLFKGSMSDVRIYCTALSAEDIKELYETSVSIDDKGNFHAYEISEV